MSTARRPSARLVTLTLALSLVLSACSAVPDRFACEHCACGPAARTISRPMLCSTFGREPECCMPIFLGS